MAQTGDYFCFGMLDVKAIALYDAPDTQGIQQYTVTADIWLHAWCLGLNCEGNTWFFDSSQGGFVYDNPKLFVARHNDPDRSLSGWNYKENNSFGGPNTPRFTRMYGRAWYDLGCCDCNDPIPPYEFDIIPHTGVPAVITSETPPVIHLSSMATDGHSGEAAINMTTRSGKKSDCYAILKRTLTFSGSVDSGGGLAYYVHLAVSDFTKSKVASFADEQQASGAWSCRKTPSTSTEGRSYQAGQ